jgi:predicted RNA-binding Zn ribbon-like protein
MASFIPNHHKKVARLHRMEDDLRRLIARNVSREKLLATAAEIRECRIRVLRARQNQNPERTTRDRENFLKQQAKIDALRQTSAETILAEYVPPPEPAQTAPS